jgi:hypothetical protein
MFEGEERANFRALDSNQSYRVVGPEPRWGWLEKRLVAERSSWARTKYILRDVFQHGRCLLVLQLHGLI